MGTSQPKYDKLVRDFSSFSGRLGILGGSFDPVHKMHLEIAHALLGRVVDNVVFIPAAQNPLKRARPTSDAHRLAMLLLAVQDEPNFFVSSIEVDRGGTSYTIETLRELRLKTNPDLELIWIVGCDCLKELPSWVAIEEILRLARIVLVQRDEEKSLEDWQMDIERLPLSSYARNKLRDDFQLRPINQISSTNIRTTIHHDGRSDGVPTIVAEYIERLGLYR